MNRTTPAKRKIQGQAASPYALLSPLPTDSDKRRRTTASTVSVSSHGKNRNFISYIDLMKAASPEQYSLFQKQTQDVNSSVSEEASNAVQSSTPTSTPTLNTSAVSSQRSTRHTPRTPLDDDVVASTARVLDNQLQELEADEEDDAAASGSKDADASDDNTTHVQDLAFEVGQSDGTTINSTQHAEYEPEMEDSSNYPDTFEDTPVDDDSPRDTACDEPLGSGETAAAADAAAGDAVGGVARHHPRGRSASVKQEFKFKSVIFDVAVLAVALYAVQQYLLFAQ